MDHSPFDFILVENSSRQSLACLELESIGSLECKLIATTTLLDLSNQQHLHTSKEWNLRQKPGERQDNSTSGRLQVLPLRKSQGQPSMSNSWTNCRKEPDMGRGPLQEAAWQYRSTLSVNTLLCRVPCWVQASNEQWWAAPSESLTCEFNSFKLHYAKAHMTSNINNHPFYQQPLTSILSTLNRTPTIIQHLTAETCTWNNQLTHLFLPIKWCGY